MFVENLDVVLVPVPEPQVSLVLYQHLLDLGQDLVLGLEGLVAAPDELPLHLIVHLLEVLDVLESELLVDDVEVPDGVHVPLHVRNVRVLKRAAQVEQRVTGLRCGGQLCKRHAKISVLLLFVVS